jgi:hypothetical protein
MPTDPQLAAADARDQAARRVLVQPAPGPMLAALLPEPIICAGFTLQPPVLSHLVLLQALDSPLLRQIAEAGKPEEERVEISMSAEELCEAIHVFTAPIRDLRSSLRQGRYAFREAALEATADHLPADASVLIELASAIARNLGREGEQAFTAQPGLPTGSAGAWTTSAPSPAT